jgi:hypothetical protein
MSQRAAVVEDFDDDTDLPLPSRPLPNTGARGPLLEEIDSDEDDLITANEPTAGPATTSQFQPWSSQPQGQMIGELHPDQKTYVTLLFLPLDYFTWLSMYTWQMDMYLPDLYRCKTAIWDRLPSHLA